MIAIALYLLTCMNSGIQANSNNFESSLAVLYDVAFTYIYAEK